MSQIRANSFLLDSKLYVISIASFYVFLALAKLWTITQPFVSDLDRPDFVFSFLTLRQLLVIGVLGELALGLVCFLNKNVRISWMCIASFSTALLAYRTIILFYLGLSPCSCMGILRRWFHISMQTESILTLTFLLVVVPLSWFYVLKSDTNSFKKQPGS